MTEEACSDVEIIGWLYQFYISEKKYEEFARLKKNRKLTPENIPAATQLFTPRWIVRYRILGRFRYKRICGLAARPDQGRAIVMPIFGERPHDLQEIFDLTSLAPPHILIAVGKLRQRVGVQLESSSEIELYVVAPGPSTACAIAMI